MAGKITREIAESYVKSKMFIRGDQTECDVSEEDKQSAKMVTFCVLILHNGHKVTGVSFSNDPEHYSIEEGKKWAYEDALKEVFKIASYMDKFFDQVKNKTEAFLKDLDVGRFAAPVLEFELPEASVKK